MDLGAACAYSMGNRSTSIPKKYGEIAPRTIANFWIQGLRGEESFCRAFVIFTGSIYRFRTRGTMGRTCSAIQHFALF